MHHNMPPGWSWLVANRRDRIVGATMLQWWQIGGGCGRIGPRAGDIGIADGRVILMMFVPSVVSLFLVP